MKRAANKRLTKENWDDEDDDNNVDKTKNNTINSGEQSVDLIDTNNPTQVKQGRVFAKAKRRLDPTEYKENTGTGGIFKGLKLCSQQQSDNNNTIFTTTAKCFQTQEPFCSTSQNKKDTSESPLVKKHDRYYDELKELNKCFLANVQTYVKQDPFCILTPMFADYTKHIDNISSQCLSFAKKVDTSESNNENKTVDKNHKDNVTSNNTITIANNTSALFSIPKTSIMSMPTVTSTTTITNPFSFNVSNSTSQKNEEMSIKPFSFGSLSSTPSTGILGGSLFAGLSSAQKSLPDVKQTTGEEEDEYVPPVTEVKEVQEKDALFSSKCKLFYEENKGWKDKGVGQVHIKPIERGDKCQLVVRADTNLGNILLNVMITKSLPITQKKNTLTFCCEPNPPIAKREGPVIFLLRLKTEDNALELEKTIKNEVNG